MTGVLKIGRDQVFNLSEANQLMPIIQKVTQRLHVKNFDIESRLKRLLMADPRRRHYQDEFKENITEWKIKMEGLGVVVHNLWKVQFNVGSGFLCWQFPELVIAHFLPEGENWDDRIKLKEYLESYDPDWAY